MGHHRDAGRPVRALCLAPLALIAACSQAPGESEDTPPTEQAAAPAQAAATGEAAASASPSEVVPYGGGDPAPSQQPKIANAIVIDPACLTSVAWFEDREAEDITLSGCRAAGELPEPDEQGWRTFEGADGDRLMVRGAQADPETGAISFEVNYSGGGTLSGRYRVDGQPTSDGVLKAGKYRIRPLN